MLIERFRCAARRCTQPCALTAQQMVQPNMQGDSAVGNTPTGEEFVPVAALLWIEEADQTKDMRCAEPPIGKEHTCAPLLIERLVEKKLKGGSA